MTKVVEKKKKVASADKKAGAKKVVKKEKGGKVSNSFLIELFVPQVVKVEGTVVSRDASGIVLMHKRRASSKLMKTRLLRREVLSMPAENGEAGTVVLRTNRKSIVRPIQYRGVCSFSEAGVTVKTVSDGSIFIPENQGMRLEITAEEE